MLSGDNGVLQRATDAKTETEKGEVYEQISLATASGEMEYYSNGTDRITAYKSALLNGVDGIDRDNLTDNGSNLITGTVTTKSGKQYDFSVPVPVTDITLAEHESIDRTGINVGDYITYTSPTESVTLSTAETGYDSEQTLSRNTMFRVLAINRNGSIDLIGVSSNQSINFKGALGYNNAVYTLNTKCNELYKNDEKRITARSIKVEDIMSKLNDVGKNKISNYISSRVNSVSGSYVIAKDLENNTVTFKNTRGYYPDIFQYESGTIIDGISSSVGLGPSEEYRNYNGLTTNTYLQADVSLTVKFTYNNVSLSSSDFETSYGDIFVRDCNAWLASRCIECNGYNAFYGIQAFGTGLFQASFLYRSGNGEPDTNSPHRVCPIITIPSNVQIAVCNETNSSSNTHTVVTE